MRRLLANLLPMARYGAKTIEHKVYVFRVGRRLKVPLWRLIIHDWTKFTPAELPHYARQFYGSKDDPTGWRRAWLHHQNHNPHHWEYWITRSDAGGLKAGEPCDMPDIFIREMVADWFAASRAYNGSYPGSLASWSWWQANRDRIVLSPATRTKLVTLLAELFPGETP